MQKKLFKNSFLPKRSSGQVECSFDNPAENFLFKIGKLFAQWVKKIHEIIIFFQKIIFCNKIFVPTRKVQFWRLSQKLLAQSPTKTLKSWCIRKMLKIFLWIRRNEFCEHQFLSYIVLTVMREGPSLPRVPMFFLKFSAISFLIPFLPTVDGKSRSAAAPLVIHLV